MTIRCTICSKKISIIEQEYCKCKCDKMFCPKHKNSTYRESTGEGHLCTFDYVTDNKDKLAKLLGEKIKKDIIII